MKLANIWVLCHIVEQVHIKKTHSFPFDPIIKYLGSSKHEDAHDILSQI